MSDMIPEKSSPSGIEVTEMFEDFFKNFYLEGNRAPIYREKVDSMAIYDRLSLEIDIDHLLEAYGKVFVEDLTTYPTSYIQRAERALEDLMLVQNRDYLAQVKSRGKWFLARFVNLSTSQLSVRDLREENIGQLVQIDGIVSRLSPTKPEIVNAVFRCRACNEIAVIDQTESHYYKEPKRCPNTVDCPSKTGPFELLTGESTFVNWQKVKVQELPDDLEPGMMPASVNLILRNDLVGLLRPGDRVRVVAICRSIPDYFKQGIKPKQFVTHVDANSMIIFERDHEPVNLSASDREAIIEASRSPFVFDKLKRSLAPAIYGMDMEKEAILLALFGGTRKTHGGIVRRGDIHILIIGDPGTGKSGLLTSAHEVAPRSVYTSGKGTTAAGLTASVVAEKGSGYTLEAGALVLADSGIAIIDEFEKMTPTDRSVLHQVMEQQVVSIAKAGINATLRAQASIIAAANPEGGRFDRAKVPAENIKMQPSLLSRFDLIFTPMDDSADIDREEEADLILGMSLGDEMIIDLDTTFSREFFKKYLCYAKHSCEPKLSREAAEVLKGHYLELRRQGQSPESPVPVTLRQLVSLIRLTEAYTRAHLRSLSTREDAEAVWGLFHAYLKAVGQDSETGAIDIDTIMTGQPLSQRKALDKAREVFGDLTNIYGNRIPEDVVLEKLAEEGLNGRVARRVFNMMIEKGEIYQPSSAEREWGLV